MARVSDEATTVSLHALDVLLAITRFRPPNLGVSIAANESAQNDFLFSMAVI